MNTRHERIRLWAPLFGLSTLFLTACGQDGSTTGTASGTAPAPAAGTAEAATATAASTGDATAEVDSAGSLIVPEDVDPAELSIVLTPSAILADGADIDADHLFELMQTHAKTVPDAKVTIYADKSLAPSVVVDVVDTAKRAGIMKYTVAKTSP